jgi:hypothetical protein
MQAKKCKVRKVWGSQNGDFINIKMTWFVSRETDLSQSQSVYKQQGIHHTVSFGKLIVIKGCAAVVLI